MAVNMAILIMVKLLRVQSCENPSIDPLGLCLLVHTCGIIVQDEYISFSYFRFVPSHNGRSMCAISLAPLTKKQLGTPIFGAVPVTFRPFTKEICFYFKRISPEGLLSKMLLGLPTLSLSNQPHMGQLLFCFYLGRLKAKKIDRQK